VARCLHGEWLNVSHFMSDPMPKQAVGPLSLVVCGGKIHIFGDLHPLIDMGMSQE
jgi:hypothetical protein